ncbi:Bud site selection protein, Revert to axial protein 1 [Rhizina undulata]
MEKAGNTRNRLPTLFEVLSRRTLPPVDLFSFYIYMRDQQRSVDYLDFWLDVAQHMSLCRHYVRELRRSVLVSTPDLEKGNSSKRSSQILEILDEDYEGSSDRHLSAFLRSDTTTSPLDSPRARGSIGDALESPHHPSYMSDPTESSSPAHRVARADIRASAEKILYTYLLRGAEREIVLPDPILSSISQAIEVDGRDDPEVFDEAKDYVFQAMERDAFPGFLRAKALGNLVPPSVMLRLIIGLLAMFGGFWAAFSLIFLDIQPRVTRLWLVLPFSIGIYCLTAHQYSLDPIMGFLGISEYTFMNFVQVQEPYVRRLLIKRSAWILSMTILLVAALTCLYVFVPGKRL